MRLPIITIPHPTLRQKSLPVKLVDKKVTDFIQNLEETLIKKTNPPGVGLSAPQVNKLWRIFCTLLPAENVDHRADLEGKEFTIQTYINPQIIAASKKLILGNEKLKARSYELEANRDPILEGCLSIPKIYGPVYRHESIKLQWQSVDTDSSDGGRQDSSEVAVKVGIFSGFTARVIQHELDHLDGILFTDRSIQQNLPIYEEQRGKLIEIKLI